MAASLDEKKAEILDRTVELARHRRGTSHWGDQGPALIRSYYRHASPEDLIDRSPDDLYGAVMSHYRLGRQRPQGTAIVRVSTPTVPGEGWSANGHSVVEVVTDDMPFLVDSVTMALAARHTQVHVVIHPQLLVRRDLTGELKEVLGEEQAESPGGDRDIDVFRESWIHVEIDRETEASDIADIENELRKSLRDVREACEDWERMRHRVESLCEELRENPPPLPQEEIDEGRALLEWLVDDHFTFLGFREYKLEQHGDEEVLKAVPGTGYGILRGDQEYAGSFGKLPPRVRQLAREKTLLVLAKANSKATVHRPVYLDYVGVKSFDANGEVDGERRFLGLYSSSAYTESLTRIPVLRQKARYVIDKAGVDPMSHAGKALMDVLENYPRDELFNTPAEELVPIAVAVMRNRERHQLKLFIRPDRYGRYLSCLVYLPRERYNTGVREKIAAILKERLHGDSVEFTARVNEAFLARLHFVIRPKPGEQIPEFDHDDIEARLVAAARSWRDDFLEAVIADYGEERGSYLARKYAEAIPDSYKEEYLPRIASADIGRLETLQRQPNDGLALSLFERMDSGPTDARLKLYRVGSALSLTRVLPVLTDLGVEVVDEHPYRFEGLDRPTYIYDFGLRTAEPIPHSRREAFQDALMAVWEERNESDGFNALVLTAGLTWRQALVLRAYAKHMRQGGTPFGQDYIEETLAAELEITRLLVDLFEARFDPDAYDDPADRARRTSELEQEIERALDDVSSLDDDRILRSYLTAIRATLRTNHFQVGADGQPHPYLSLKLNPAAIPDLPEPRPKFEIFVYSPRVEGVHLRFGAVARGGLRWSDRRDDFRTEVLGLVKAQMVKNAVIVPSGAKGGFFAKRLPDPSDREAFMAEGIACYRTFISGLLDVTDNLVDGQVSPPTRVVRHDEDDPYLVVAADKGTATFSDIANQVSADYGFWLGDAFASGGSVGYDHKAMGITARGAWVSVRRHFREMDVDCQTEDITVVGIGDMSGDVFGNGMLCSEHIRLVAAFDHRDIFLDPDPDAAASYKERRRLFDTPRTSWQDYDSSLISEGGGVYSRSLKSIPISEQVRRALGIDDGVSAMTPQELMRAILLAPVDLLWNGGIGTYVKSAAETHADAGDKANDAIRVNGGDLRVKCVGEGGNLGFTQRGRIEFTKAGGRINTDFIDNSAGVDTSDHEVNIKILLDQVVANGDMTVKQRNDLLASMTDEVGGLVLADNYDQNIALINAVLFSPGLLHVQEDWIRTLEREGLLNRELEFLPSRKQMAQMRANGEGLSAPDLCVLLAYTKIALADRILESDLPDDAFFRSELISYFPSKMRQTYRSAMDEHPLRREIIATQVVNQFVNNAGITYFHRLSGETGADGVDIVRAYLVAREIFGAPAIMEAISALDNQVPVSVQNDMRLPLRSLVEWGSRWLLGNRRAPLDSEATVDHFGVEVERVVRALPDILIGKQKRAFDRRYASLVDQQVPEELARQVAALPPAAAALAIVEIGKRDGVDPVEVARVHLAMSERLGLHDLFGRIQGLPRSDRWQTMARSALRDDLDDVAAALTARVIASTDAELSAEARVAAWEAGDERAVSRAVETLTAIAEEEDTDLARLSVAVRVVRSLLP